MKIAIVLPTYNERENVKQLIPMIFKISNENELLVNLIVVDDNSPDDTSKIVRKFSEIYPITLIQRESKLGIGSAYIIGFKKALESDSDIIFEMDADLSHDPMYIPRFIQKINQGSYYFETGFSPLYSPVPLAVNYTKFVVFIHSYP